MSTFSLFGLDEIQQLENKSDYNLVRLYINELNRIDRGYNYRLHKCDRNLLTYKGIIYYDRATYLDHRWRLTDKAKRILDSIMNNEKVMLHE